MPTQPVGPAEEFCELVRDALLHLFEPAHLQVHPLLAAIDDAGSPAVSPPRRLRQSIVDAIEALHPQDGTPVASRAWRAYRILELRYIEGQDSTAVAEQVCLSRAQYHRDHQRALQAVAALLWTQWRTAERWPPTGLRDGELAPADELTRREADALRQGAGDGRIEPVEVCQSVGRLLERLYRSRAATLRMDLPNRLPAIRGERVALRQALLAILSHALDTASADASTVDVTGAQHEDLVILEISGPAPEPLASLEAGGAEIRPFIDGLRGKLRYEPPSAPNQPWRLSLAFPISARRTLLVVDNSADFILLVERYLSDHDWAVVGAGAVEQAVTLARECLPQAIILDIVLPERDGWELLEELKAHHATATIPVVVCSVLDEPAVALSLGAEAYLRKPIDQQRLIATLTTLDGNDGRGSPPSPQPGRGGAEGERQAAPPTSRGALQA